MTYGDKTFLETAELPWVKIVMFSSSFWSCNSKSSFSRRYFIISWAIVLLCELIANSLAAMPFSTWMNIIIIILRELCMLKSRVLSMASALARKSSADAVMLDTPIRRPVSLVNTLRSFLSMSVTDKCKMLYLAAKLINDGDIRVQSL